MSLQRAFGGIELFESVQLQTKRVIIRIALEIADVVIPIIAAHIHRTIFTPDFFKADYVCGEFDGFFQICRSEPAIPESSHIDHHISPVGSRYSRPIGGS